MHDSSLNPIELKRGMKNHAGLRNGRLTWVRPMERARDGAIYWECQCDCGKISHVQAQHRGFTMSCGCLISLVLTAACTKTGHSKSRTYNIWNAMRARCDNPKNNVFQYYGGRGICYDHRWRFFSNFFADMGLAPDGLTIDRIDNNGNYSKDNCRWATYIEQENNRRNNRIIELRGECFTLSELSRKIGMDRSTLSDRIERGWPIERAVSIAARKYNKSLSARSGVENG